MAERAWVLPTWFECIAQQTVQPIHYCFVYSVSRDQTKQLIKTHCPAAAGLTLWETNRRYIPREGRNKDPRDPWRAKHFAALRNQLRDLFLGTQADIFVSLDTDILLQRPDALAELCRTLADGWDVACALTYLHPAGEVSHCYNAGFFTDEAWGSFHQGWRRAEPAEFELTAAPVPIQVPMAAFAITRRALDGCIYQEHDCGEDVGFAQRLHQRGCKVGWRTDLPVRHVWDQHHL